MGTGYAAKPSNYELLLKLRQSKTVTLKPCPYIKETTKLRYYQVVAVAHFVSLARMILGDGVGLGKSVQLLAAFAHMLVKDPTLKCLIIVPKSARFQWAEEVKKFLQGVSVHVLRNEYAFDKATNTYGTIEDFKKDGRKFKKLEGFEARKAQYDTITTNILISTYFTVQEDYTFLAQNRSPNFVFAMDECFEYHARVLMADGTTEQIGKIVGDKKPVEVMSYNEEKGILEPKKVVNFFNNRYPEKIWLKVKGLTSDSAVCTPNHSFYTPQGKKPAGSLKKGDKIYSFCPRYEPVQMQVALGSLLGDGSLRYSKNYQSGRNIGITLSQSIEHLAYIELKQKVLGSHVSCFSEYKTGWNRVPVRYVRTYANAHITQKMRAWGVIDSSRKRRITLDCLNDLNEVGIAIWYCDNGSRCKSKSSTVSLHTERFSKEENELIAEYFLNRWGVEFKLQRSKGKYWSLRANKDASALFFNIFRDYIPESMSYKADRFTGVFWSKFVPETPDYIRYEDKVEYVEVVKYSEKTLGTNARFNIEVEDNHNYFVGRMLVSNCQEIKNAKTKTHFGADYISAQATRVYGLSATLIKNRLEEAYNIYKVVVPGLFGGKNHFLQEYTIRKKMEIWRKGKKQRFNKIVGYTNLPKFKDKIDPFFLIRRTQDVASELPKLISKKVQLEMTKEQSLLYKEALSGDLYKRLAQKRLLAMKDKISSMALPSEADLVKLEELQQKYEESLTKEGLVKSKLAALTYCQLVSNGPGWVGEPGESSKEQEFKRLFEQELCSDKVIIFTRFKSGIKRLEAILDGLEMKHVKITGDDSSEDRDKARLAFQDTNSGVDIIFITYAGSAALNLQSARVLLFVDTPWSYGDLYQTIGRAQRIGSIYEHVVLIHMVNEKTIDEHVMKILEMKKSLINDIMGDIAQGAIEFDKGEILFKEDESDIDALYHSMFYGEPTNV